MAKTYSADVWKAIKKYWENNISASYKDAANAIAAQLDITVPSKAAIGKKAIEEKWRKRDNQNSQIMADIIDSECREIHDQVDGDTSQVDGQVDGKSSQVDGEKEGVNKALSIANINTRAKKKADLKQALVDGQVDGLAGVILDSVNLTSDEIDDICADYRASILQKHRCDFDSVDSVVNTCVGLFKKAMDAIASGGYVTENDVIDGDGFIHKNLMANLKLADGTIKSMFNVSLIKTNKQNNERKAYGLDTYEEPSETGNLAQKALSSKGMGNHYERIRLSKKEERERMKDKLKGVA